VVLVEVDETALVEVCAVLLVVAPDVPDDVEAAEVEVPGATPVVPPLTGAPVVD
jgi:hypothetical protein